MQKYHASVTDAFPGRQKGGLDVRFQGLGFGVWCLGFRVLGLGFRVWGSG